MRDFDFWIRINTTEALSNIANKLKLFPFDIEWESDVRGRTSHNYLILGRNEFHDPKKLDGPKAYLYFKYEIGVTYRGSDTTSEEEAFKDQADFARTLLLYIREQGYSAELSGIDIEESVD